MNPQKNKKGFTIVELTIVIAVIAILAAVLIPTFTGLVKKADRSADVQMVVNLNKYLAAMENLDGKNETMADAMADAAETGYGLDAFRQDGDITILWNRETDRFLAVEDGKIITADETAEYEYDGEMIADKKGEALCDVKSIYWTISNQISGTYATYLTDNSAFSGEPVEIKLGLDTTAYTGDKNNINIHITDNVILSGVFYSVNCINQYAWGIEYSCKPIIYGYVYKLEGDAESKNATFHMKPEETAAQSEGNKAETKPNATDGSEITGSYIVDHLLNEERCYFCDIKEEQGDKYEDYYKHTHEWTKNDKLSDPPKCEEEGKVYYTCGSSETCQAIKVDTIDALGHDMSAFNSDVATHWKKCTRDNCGYEDKADKYGYSHKELHTIDWATYSCSCGYVATEEQKAVYKKAVEMNSKLTTTYPTMYDTFYALCDKDEDFPAADAKDKDSLTKINTAIKGVISGIDTAEGDTGLKILWDQTIGKFSVVAQVDGVTYVNYAVEGGQIGKVNYTYLLWDTFDNEKNKLTINDKIVKDNVFSIYWAENDKPTDWRYNAYQMIYVGFDMGTWKTKGNGAEERFVIIISQYGVAKDKPVIIRTECAIEESLYSDGANDKIQLSAHSGKYVKHYGTIEQVDFNTTCEYYEYGDFKKIRVSDKEVTGNIYMNGTITEDMWISTQAKFEAKPLT